MSSNVTLVGDAIENPANALTMTHAAAMFGASCRFRDTKGLASSEVFATGLPAISSDQVRTLHSHVIACDNLPGAKDVYGFDAGRNFALMVGNERRGLSHEFQVTRDGYDPSADAFAAHQLSERSRCIRGCALLSFRPPSASHGNPQRPRQPPSRYSVTPAREPF